MAGTALTLKQEAFCLAYVETGNASEAYRRAFNAAAMKPETVNRRAFDLINNGKIKARIAELREAVASKVVVGEARIIEELGRIAVLDPARLFGTDGEILPVQQMAPEVRAAIASVKVTEVVGDNGKVVRKTEVKLWDKNSAIDKIARHLGIYERDNQQRASALDGIPRDVLRQIVDRLHGGVAPDS